MNPQETKKYLDSLPGVLKHKEVAQAFANGAPVQFRAPDATVWSNMWDDRPNLDFLENYEYRIKPFVVTGYVCVEAYGDKKTGDISQDRPPPYVRRHWQYFSTEVEVKK